MRCKAGPEVSARRPCRRDWNESHQYRRTLPSRRRHLLPLLASYAALFVTSVDAACVPLKGSKTCPAFQSASISSNDPLSRTFPFLQFVSDTASFDSQLSTYVKTSYVRDKYQNVLGCADINYTDTTNFYARYTTTVLCNTLVQQSIKDCNLSQDASPPVCADTCADFARSEAYVTADTDLCARPGSDLNKLIRADFTVCSLPEGSLQSRCVAGFDNEPENCGFANSTLGLCSYCKAGGINSTDTCCYTANAEQRCQGVKLPSITPTMTFSTPLPTSTSGGSNQAAATAGRGGLSGGAIAGIVIGALAGVALLALLLLLCTRMLRRRGRGSQRGSIFNQPSPARQGPAMAQTKQTTPEGYEVLPGGRVARMSALEGLPGDSPVHRSRSRLSTGAPGLMAGRGKDADDRSSSSEDFGDVLDARGRNALRPPAANRRQGSLSSGSLLASDGHQSPASAGEFSSPLGMASQNSEQLPFFRDYYSQDDIHPSDRVAVLWAYQPRAADEFALERGDMLKVVGIWDDGWATGVMLDERAEDWEAKRQVMRDSGVSNTFEPRDHSPIGTHGEMKAFPLVCVCLPDHWRKTIDGDGSTDTASNGAQNAPPS